MNRRVVTDLAVVVALTLATNFAYLACSNGDYFFPDSFTYLTPAHNLLAGRGFVDHLQQPETLRTPGYPLFLLPFLALSQSVVPIVVVQHLLNALLAAAIYLLARRRAGRGIAMIAALIFATDTITIHYANKVLTENLFTLLLFIVCLLALRIAESPRTLDVVVAAAISSLLVLIRPVAIAWFLVPAIFFVINRVPWRKTLAFIVIALALPVAWGIRNQRKTGVFTIASIAGTNMLAYRAAGAIAIESPEEPFAEALAREQQELVVETDGDIEEAMHIEDAGELPHAVRAREYAKVGRRIMLEHPYGSAMLVVRGLLVIFFESDYEAMMMISRLHESIVSLTIDAWTAMTFAFAVAGLLALRRRDRTLAILIALTVGYFALVSAGGEAEARFRVPFVPLYAIAAATGIRRAFGRGDAGAEHASDEAA